MKSGCRDSLTGQFFFYLESLSLMDMFSLKLLRTFYTEDLVDHRTFLTWLVQQMTTCNLAQAGFLTRLTDEYANDILTHRALARPLAEACLAKLSEVMWQYITFRINPNFLSDMHYTCTRIFERY